MSPTAPSTFYMKQDDGHSLQDYSGHVYPSTPSKKTRGSSNGTTTSSPSPSKRIKAEGSTTSSPSDCTKASSKWSAWEDQIIKDSIVQHGEKGTDWHAILKKINDKRGPEGPRTLNSLKLHWMKPLKGKMLDC